MKKLLYIILGVMGALFLYSAATGLKWNRSSPNR